MLKFRQVSEKFIDKKSYYEFYFRSRDFRNWALILIGGYLAILGIVLISVYSRGELHAQLKVITIFFFLLLLLVLYLLFISPIIFLKKAWNQYFVFDKENVELISSNINTARVVPYKDIYSICYTESLNAVAIFYKTNDWRINQVLGLTGVEYDDFIKISNAIKVVRNDLNIIKRNNSFF